MTIALQNAQKCAPRTNSFPVLVRHNPGNLMHMREIVDGPSGQQFRQSN
jgi:hypothetical protein